GPKIIKPIIAITKEHIEEAKNKPIKIDDLLRPQQPAPAEVGEEEDTADKKDKKRAIPGREERQKKRNIRAEERKKTRVEIVDGKVVEIEDDRVGKLHPSIKKKHQRLIKQRPTRLELAAPITVRLLSEELGVRAVELMFKVKEHGV